LGWGSVGFNGQTQIATPNLDALAAGGMRLNNSYACPVCAASRALLYTGFNQAHANVDGNSELAQGFRADEVMTAQVLARRAPDTIPPFSANGVSEPMAYGASAGAIPFRRSSLPTVCRINTGLALFTVI
jgi:hypothetical protein